MKVPPLDVVAQNKPLEEEFVSVLRETLGSGRFILGDEVTAVEETVAKMAGVEHGIFVSSGTDALLLALMALDIGPGDEVICPAFTFFATAGSIARTGATPIFVDACGKCFNTTAKLIEPHVTERTKAIMPVHLFGQSAPMEPILALAEKHGIPVIEDAAQAIGATCGGRAVGGMGTIGTFSFYPTKNLGACGDAGMMVTNDTEIAKKARALRNHGCETRYYHQLVGGNFRGDALQAAFLNRKLPSLEQYVPLRAEVASFYTEALAPIAGSAVTLPASFPEKGHTWNQFTLRVHDGKRDALKQHLNEAGIFADIYYPLTLDRQECFAHLNQSGDHLKTSHLLAEEVLSIPIFPEITTEQRNFVIQTTLEFFN